MAAKRLKPEFTKSKRCVHCGNEAPMEIVAKYDDLQPTMDQDGEIDFVDGHCYELVKCPACKKVELRTYYLHSSGDEERSYKTLYPTILRDPLGLPPQIAKEYKAARKVRDTSANAYGVLVGRVLELVCEDRKAVGGNLYNKLIDLAQKNEIPGKLVVVADKLRIFRNFGAHASMGGLTEKEVPILESLSRAILEYVYSAPYLAEEAKKALELLKKREKEANNPGEKGRTH